jgi:hypothetical protein
MEITLQAKVLTFWNCSSERHFRKFIKFPYLNLSFNVSPSWMSITEQVSSSCYVLRILFRRCSVPILAGTSKSLSTSCFSPVTPGKFQHSTSTRTHSLPSRLFLTDRTSIVLPFDAIQSRYGHKRTFNKYQLNSEHLHLNSIFVHYNSFIIPSAKRTVYTFPILKAKVLPVLN